MDLKWILSFYLLIPLRLPSVFDMSYSDITASIQKFVDCKACGTMRYLFAMLHTHVSCRIFVKISQKTCGEMNNTTAMFTLATTLCASSAKAYRCVTCSFCCRYAPSSTFFWRAGSLLLLLFCHERYRWCSRPCRP